MAGDRIVTTPTELLKSLEGQQLKQWVVKDLNGRPQFIFEATVDAKEGDPCLVTEYVYPNATTRDICAHQERVYRWKEIWDTPFTFDPNIDYDIDGDGVI